jgi:hypothetical protein
MAEAIAMGRHVSSGQFRRGIFTCDSPERKFLIERTGSISQRATLNALEF